MNSYLVCLIFVAVIGTADAGNCRSGWKPYGRKCYKAFLNKQIYSDAARLCGQAGGYLAEPLSTDENRFIYWMIRGISYLGFTGKNKIFKDRTGRNLHFTHWNGGEPNNHSGNENCVEMHDRHGGGWNDVSCLVPFGYVCEYQMH